MDQLRSRQNSLKKKIRHPMIDQIRGIAIVLMVFFHFFFDLNIFGGVSINFSKDIFWYFLPRVIVFLFLLAVGMSLSLVHEKEIKWKKFIPRLLKISLFALIISIMTKWLFPQSWVYFGTLHCIALCSLWALPFVKYPRLSLFIGLSLIGPSALFDKTLPWFLLPHASMDYISPFPWFGVVCLGIFLKHRGFHTLKIGHGKIQDGLSLLGRHSLNIYILHQPTLYGLLYLFFKIKNSLI